MELSLVIPVKDEEQNIAALAGEIDRTMQQTSWSWECIWIDDGSTDNTLTELQRLNQQDSRHTFISLSRNYGQAAALVVGFRHAKNDIIATLDGDGQNDPADLPELIKRLLDDDADMVNGWRQKRMDSFVRKISSSIANGFRNWVTREQIRDVGCSLRVFRRECVEDIPVFKGMHRFLPTLVRMRNFDRIVEVPVAHRPRKRGLTKYGIHNRLWVGIADTFAVRWMQSRLVYPEIKTSSSDQIRKREK